MHLSVRVRVHARMHCTRAAHMSSHAHHPPTPATILRSALHEARMRVLMLGVMLMLELRVPKHATVRLHAAVRHAAVRLARLRQAAPLLQVRVRARLRHVGTFSHTSIKAAMDCAAICVIGLHAALHR